MPRKILILYTEIAGYTLASLNALANERDTELHLVRWPVNAEAPFDFRFSPVIKVYDRKQYNLEALIRLADAIQPDIILCSGWIDKDYLQVCKKWRKKIPVVLAMDNKWKGTARQRIAVMIARYTIHRSFSHCWVPGKKQLKYAQKLGFDQNNIKTGFYTADVSHFRNVWENNRNSKKEHFPHVFVYAGRYYEFKGVKELWNAFLKLKKEHPNNWKLLCLGTGDIKGMEHPDIEHKGFIQPDQLPEIMKQSGVFILPSRVEPWGVVVQEFAAAGFPLLLSDQVGAEETFLVEGKNGWLFKAGDVDAIVMAMQSVVETSDDKLNAMGDASAELALNVTPKSWAETLLSILPHS